MRALFGLLYLCGLHKSSHTNAKDLSASDGSDIEILLITMSFNQLRVSTIPQDMFQSAEQRMTEGHLKDDNRIAEVLSKVLLQKKGGGGRISRK